MGGSCTRQEGGALPRIPESRQASLPQKADQQRTDRQQIARSAAEDRQQKAEQRGLADPEPSAQQHDGHADGGAGGQERQLPQ